jgi:hypothetical protein
VSVRRGVTELYKSELSVREGGVIDERTAENNVSISPRPTNSGTRSSANTSLARAHICSHFSSTATIARLLTPQRAPSSTTMSDSEDPVDLADDGGDDLFGDDLDEAGSEPGNVLSDKDLASDQDDDLEPRDEDGGDQPEVREKVIYGVEMFRHRIPKSKNGTVCCTPRAARAVASRFPAADLRSMLGPIPQSSQVSQVRRDRIRPRHLSAV